MSEANVVLALVSRTEVSIELRDGEIAASKLTLDLADVEALIAGLAQLRMAMTPEIVREVPESAHRTGVLGPPWAVARHPSAKEKTLFVRHPGFGWVTFVLPPEEAQKMGNALSIGQPP